MIDDRKRISRRTQLGLGAALVLALGAAGGAGAVSLTRPTVEMAPTVPTAIAELPTSNGVVTVKGRVAEVYGNKFVVQDATGRTMVDAGRGRTMTAGTPVTVQGRFDDGQLHASYLVDPNGRVEAVGPMGPHGARGPEGRGPDGRGPGRDGPPPPPPGGPDRGPGFAGAGAPPPPPPGCGPVGAVGAVPPAPVNGRVPPVASGATPTAPAPAPTATPAT